MSEKNNKMPKVSVVLPLFNGEKTVQEMIESVLAQTYKNIELIIVDDASTDKSREIVKSFTDSRIKYFDLGTKKNTGGGAPGRNKAIENSDGEFIAFCDQDDVWKPEKLERQIKTYEDSSEKKKIGVVVTSTVLLNPITKKKVDRNILAFQGFLPAEKSHRLLLMGDFIANCSSLVPREVFDEFGPLETELTGKDDYILWLKITKKYGVLGLREVLAIRIESEGGWFRDRSKEYIKNEPIFERLEKKDNSQEVKIGHGKNLMRIFTSLILQKNHEEAKKFAKKAKKYPLSRKAKIIVKSFEISPNITGCLLRLADKLGQISL